MGQKNKATNWHYIQFGTTSDGTITCMLHHKLKSGLIVLVPRCTALYSLQLGVELPGLAGEVIVVRDARLKERDWD